MSSSLSQKALLHLLWDHRQVEGDWGAGPGWPGLQWNGSNGQLRVPGECQLFKTLQNVDPVSIYAIFLGVSPPWVTLELLFGKKYSPLGIMERVAAKWKQTMAMRSNSKQRGRGTREGASSLVSYNNQNSSRFMSGTKRNINSFIASRAAMCRVKSSLC